MRLKLPFDLELRRGTDAAPDWGYILPPDRLAALAREHAPGWRAAQPFPHAVFDDFLPEAVVDEALAVFPAGDDPYWDTKKKRMAFKQDSRRLDKERLLPPFLRRLLWELNSSAFLLFLTELTGIEGLVSDPYLEGGGVHQIPRGGYLKIHADFNRHPLTGLERRLNVLIYLNRNWRKAWGGALELWSPDMRSCVRSIAPIAGRCVVIETGDASFHGHPDPLACPKDRTRKSIALYYYTAAPADGEAHTTRYQKRPQEA